MVNRPNSIKMRSKILSTLVVALFSVVVIGAVPLVR